MNTELKELISKHLPSLAAGEMSKYIEQAEKDKKVLETLQSNYELKLASLKEYENKYNTLKSAEGEIQTKGLELDKKEKELQQKEINLRISELTYQLEAEKRSKDSIYSLVSTFVANPRAIETMNRTYTTQTGTHYSNGHESKYVTGGYETGTTEIKETKIGT